MTFQAAPPHPREEARQAALDDLAILDTEPEQDFDDLTALAASILDVPISLVSFIDRGRQWFKSHHGLDAQETPRDWAFCAHAIQDAPQIMIVPDAREDARFQGNPLVTGEPNIRFYVGVPLEGPRGLPMGTLCAIDRKPRSITQDQREALEALARQVSNHLKIRYLLAQLQRTERSRDLMLDGIIHDVSGPLLPLDWHLRQLGKTLDQSHLEGMRSELDRLRELITTLREAADAARNSAPTQIRAFCVGEALGGLLKSFKEHLKLDGRDLLVHQSGNVWALADAHRVEDALQNLLLNAQAYGTGPIHVQVSRSDDTVRIDVHNEGIGFDPTRAEQLFTAYERGQDVRAHGHGLGLYIARAAMTRMGGDVVGKSEGLGRGATFTITMPATNPQASD